MCNYYCNPPSDKQEYTSEGIDWTHIEFEDNQECLELIEKVSIMSIFYFFSSPFSFSSGRKSINLPKKNKKPNSNNDDFS